jgi:hypothetical protein
MRTIALPLAALYLFSTTSAQAAYQFMPVTIRQRIVEGNREHYQTSRPAMPFQVEVISDDEGLKPETARGRHSYIAARRDERYALRLHNPLPVRVAVNLTVDGLNSIDGKPTGIRDGQKWLIEPYGVITIRGWQVNGQESRRFFFTDKPKSYAKWRGGGLRKDLSANCGVIGAAFFWNQTELDAYYREHPLYRPYAWYGGCMNRRVAKLSESRGASADAIPKESSLSAAPPEKKQEAGTGMGEREVHPVIDVAFNYDSGMYSVKDAVVIYYDFAQEPNPFPALSYAPEMP